MPRQGPHVRTMQPGGSSPLLRLTASPARLYFSVSRVLAQACLHKGWKLEAYQCMWLCCAGAACAFSVMGQLFSLASYCRALLGPARGRAPAGWCACVESLRIFGLRV